jgi:hypothetical protein
MSSTKLDALISEFPEEGAAIERLRAMVSEPPAAPLTVQRLYDLMKPSSLRALALIMSRATQEGMTQKFFRVESKRMGGIGDFDKLEEIPQVIFDSRLGEEIEVQDDQVNLLYRIVGENAE